MKSSKRPKSKRRGKPVTFFGYKVSPERAQAIPRNEHLVFQYEGHDYGIPQNRRPSLDYYDNRR